MRRRVLMAAVVASLAASGLVAPPAAAQPGAVVASASGSGHMVRNGFFRTFTFTAQRFADGTSSGQLQLRSPEFDVVVHLRIDCLRVDGRTAHLSGRISYTSDPQEAFVGELNRLVVQDNGARPGDPPDMVSGIPANPGNTNPETCETNTLTPNRIVQRGDVHVRG